MNFSTCEWSNASRFIFGIYGNHYEARDANEECKDLAIVEIVRRKLYQAMQSRINGRDIQDTIPGS